MNHESHITLENMSQALWYNQWTLKKISHFLHGNILEVGCGIGNFTKTLIEYGETWAFDIDRDCVTETKQKLGKRAHVGLGNIEKGTYFFKDKSFDTIVCFNVLEHVNDDTQALEHIASLLRPNGTFIGLVPIHPWLYGTIDEAIYHYRRYNPEQFVKQIEANGLTIEYKRILNFIGAIGWFVSGKLLKRKAIGQRQIESFNTLAPYILPLEDAMTPPFGTSILVVARKPKKQSLQPKRRSRRSPKK